MIDNYILSHAIRLKKYYYQDRAQNNLILLLLVFNGDRLEYNVFIW